MTVEADILSSLIVFYNLQLYEILLIFFFPYFNIDFAAESIDFVRRWLPDMLRSFFEIS